MRVQIDRFEDGGWAVLVPYPRSGVTFDVPREMIPPGCSAGDVLVARFIPDEAESRRAEEEGRALMNRLLGRGELDEA
ncbi:DUF3006 domain-containing protein [Rubrobacter calidifluminis]|uniref:DUF3006 domain-containing protein n=1 Tax=Rubrobacter calidifluminis TaxID=1392640 RepID=UPI0023609557|nr:DUF3006 domain-containing protein [Rubrobacter calidifluminis]